MSEEDLDERSAYLRPGTLDCRVMDGRSSSDGRELVSVDTELPSGIESTEGKTRFEAFRDQLIELQPRR